MPTSNSLILELDVGIFGIVSNPKFWDSWKGQLCPFPFKLKDKINHHSVD